MANPETPRQNPRIPFGLKDISEPLYPTSPTPRPKPSKTNSNSKIHNPPPQSFSSSSSAQSSPSSRSYSSAPSSPIRTAPTTPSLNLTSKMRNLWNTSQSKSFLSNLNIGLATNFPLKNLNLHSKKSSSVVSADEEVWAAFGRDEYHNYIHHGDHTNYSNYSNQTNDVAAAIPIPKLSSPNGKPAKPLLYSAMGDTDANPLSGPSTQHAEYLISRVEGRFMGPDTSPIESPSREALAGGMLFGYGGGNGRLGNERMKGTYKNENEGVAVGNMRGTGDEIQGIVKSRNGRGREKMLPKKHNQKTWKYIHQSCKEMLDSMHLSKCDGEVTKVTGQENGNRFVGAEDCMDKVNDEDDDEGNEAERNNTEGHDGSDVFTDAYSGAGSGRYWGKYQHRHRLIHTESQDSMVEIYTSLPVSTSTDPSASCPFSRFGSRKQQDQKKTQMQMQHQLAKQSQKKSSAEITPVIPSSSSPDNSSTITANSHSGNHHESSDDTIKLENQNQASLESEIEDPLNEFILTPRKPLQESDFAYMHMRPKPRTNPDATPGNSLTIMPENGIGNTYQYCYPNNKANDDNEDARSSLDMEDSLYDDEKPQQKFKLRMPRAEAEYPDFGTMMDRDRDMYTDTDTDMEVYPSTPTQKTQTKATPSWSQKHEFDADAALEASLSSLSRLQYEYQLECLAGSQGSIVS
ncbi:hypothetical protein BPOR_1357g00010 [Botrytis porri]|uniref:Uncharacterized protein n=1 Tax=Botrytis porri TaxID=87229 RepID=A0A4Z1KC25_9HELO|nr:hypothetical protein BPOR_1357g00010 [Botrytis porri]